jgi:hypothetical protein
MSEWAYNHCIKIDTIFVEQKTIEDVINLQFNPSNGIATYRLAKHGISILICYPRGIAETKQIHNQEHAAKVTKGTQLLDEGIKLTKTNTRLPASTPSSLLSLIMDKVMFAEVIHRPTFPCKWEISIQPQHTGYMPKTDPKVLRHSNKLTHPGAGDRAQTNPGPQPSGTKWIHPRELRHTKIKALIDPVLARGGNRFAIRDILRGGNVSINDLPRLPKYQESSGWSTICRTNVLRGCTYKDCPFKPQGGHVARDDITDGFADAVCDKLGKGVMYVIGQEQGERTAKKTKTITGGATNLTATQE